LGGPGGAIAAGLAMDGLTTGIDSAVHKEYRPSGLVASGTALAKGEDVVENLGGLAVTLGGDGLTGAYYRPKAKPTGKTARMNAKAKYKGKKAVYKVKKILGKEGEIPNPVLDVGAGKQPLPKPEVVKIIMKDSVNPKYVAPKVGVKAQINAMKDKPEERSKSTTAGYGLLQLNIGENEHPAKIHPIRLSSQILANFESTILPTPYIPDKENPGKVAESFRRRLRK